MTNTFSYKNFDLTLFLHGSYGNKVFNNIDRMLTGMGFWNNQLTKVMGYAQLGQINDGINYPRTKINAQGENYIVNNWFEDPDNVKVLNPGGTMPRADQNDPADNDRLSSRYIEDGSYLRIKNITLGYTLPKKYAQVIRFENVRVYMNIQNLYTFTKYSGYDPEVGVNPQDAQGFTFGFDNGRYPAPRIISFGANLTF
jgi:hypothetical protein